MCKLNVTLRLRVLVHVPYINRPLPLTLGCTDHQCPPHPEHSYRSTSSGRLERDLRRREHDALLALLRGENIFSASGQRVLARVRRRKERCPRAGSCRESGMSEEAKKADCAGGDSGGGRHPERGRKEEGGDDEDEEECGSKEEDGEGSENEHDHADTSRLKTPLTPEAWRDVLAALERSLRLVRGAGRAGEEEEKQRRPQRRRQMATVDPSDISSVTNDGGRLGHRQASLLSAAPKPGSLSPEPPRPRSSRSTNRNGGGALGPAGGDDDLCGASSCVSRPHPRSCDANPRKAYGERRCERSGRSEVEEVSSERAGGGATRTTVLRLKRSEFVRPSLGGQPCTAHKKAVWFFVFYSCYTVRDSS